MQDVLSVTIKGDAAGTGVHTLYAFSYQGYGHGDMSLSIGLSTLMCIPAAKWCGGVQVARLLDALP